MLLNRYTSAVISSTAMTLGLLFIMQFLIQMQPFKLGVVPESRPVIFRTITDRPPLVNKHKQPPTRKELTQSQPMPPRTGHTGPSIPIGLPTVTPTVPGYGLEPVSQAYNDGPLVNLVRVAPIYPSRALVLGVEGYAIVEFSVEASGEVTNIVVIESSSSLFVDAARQAAKRFKFKPRIVDGVAQATHGLRNRFTFTLDDTQ